MTTSRTLARITGSVVAVLALGSLPVVPSPGAAAGTATPVMGKSVLIADQLAAWYRSTGRTPNPGLDVSVDELARLFIAEGHAEGVRGDLAFAQTILETGYLGFSSTVPPQFHNYAGIGAPNETARFPDARTGVRAQIQHLRAYADPTVQRTGTANPLVDPRFQRVNPKGQAPTWEQFGNGVWAPGSTYGADVLSIYARMLAFVPPSLRGQSLAAPVVGLAAPTGAGGYWLAGRDGGVFTLGAPGFFGSAGALRLRAPVVGAVARTRGDGYWLAAADGGVFAYGAAAFLGSAAPLPLVKPIVGMAVTPSGNGYWLVAADGGVFTFGDARFFGSTGNLPLVKPIVGMAVTPSGNGYWLVAADGGVFTFGDARFFGSTGNLALVKPIVGMAVTPSGNGYWLVAADGGVFTFGDARFFGSTGGQVIDTTVVGISALPDRQGYRLAAADGGVFAYAG